MAAYTRELSGMNGLNESRLMKLRYHWRRIIVCVGLLGVTACVGDKGVAPVIESPTAILGMIRVAPVNAVMAIGDTMSLTVTGRTLTGESLTSFDSVEYFLQNTVDTVRARVSRAGVVTAVGTTNPRTPVLIQIVAFKDGLARADQAGITIVASAFSGATLSIHPVPPNDSAFVAVGAFKTIIPVIGNTAGANVSNAGIRLEAGPGDSTKLLCYIPNFVATSTLTEQQLQAGTCTSIEQANLRLDQIFANRIGTAWVHANVTVFGVPLRDSVQYTLTNPLNGSVFILPTNFGIFSRVGPSLLIAPGGTILFSNNFDPSFGVSIRFAFDQPAAATVANPPATAGDTIGNITPLAGSEVTTRRFLTPGVYKWTATASGGVAPFTGATTEGIITVQ